MQTFKFELDSEDLLLQKTLNKAFNKMYPSNVMREFIEEKKINKQIHQFLNEQGLLGILNPKNSDEGMNLSYCTILAAEIGKRLISFPVIEHLLGCYILKQLKDTSIIADYEFGGKIATIGWKENVDLENGSDRPIVNGGIQSIPFANIADTFIVPIRRKISSDKDQVLIFDTHPLQNKFRLMKTLDVTYPLYELTCHDLLINNESFRIVEIDLDEFNKISDLLLSAELLGIMEEVLEITIDYSMERKQFGVELGKFQSLKHMLADMYLLCESSKVSIEFGAWSIENNGEDTEIVSSIMKAYSSDAAIRIVENAIQIHGGVGFTWEHHLHFYLKRAYRLAYMFKSPVDEREKIATTILDELKIKNENNILLSFNALT